MSAQNINIFTSALDQMTLSIMGANKRVGIFEKAIIKVGKAIHDTAVGSLLVYGKALVDTALAAAQLQETDAEKAKAMKKLSLGMQMAAKTVLKFGAGMQFTNAIFEFGVAQWGAGNKVVGGLVINFSRLLAVFTMLSMVILGVAAAFVLYQMHVDGLDSSVVTATEDVMFFGDAFRGMATIMSGDTATALQLMNAMILSLVVVGWVLHPVFGALSAAAWAAGQAFNFVAERTGSVQAAWTAFGATLGVVFGAIMILLGEFTPLLGGLTHLFSGISVLGWTWVAQTLLWMSGIGVAMTGVYLAIKEPLDSVMYYFGLLLTFVGTVMAVVGYVLAGGAAIAGGALAGMALAIAAAVVLVIDTLKILLSGGSLIETWRDRWGNAMDWIGEKWTGMATKAGELKDSVTSEIGEMRDTVVGFGAGMVDGFMERINGIADVFKTAWNMLIDEINPAIIKFNNTVGSVPGVPNIPELEYLAKGGPATGGKPYIVGEQGPELFVPGSSGHVTPNHELGGTNVTMNINVSGITDRTDKRALAREIGDMLTQELRRTGGAPTRGRF